MYQHLFRITVIVVSVLLLSICTLLFLTYIAPTESPVVKKFSGIFPAITVDGTVITVGEITANTQATRTFYENQDLADNGVRVDYTTADGQKRLKLIEREVANNLTENAVVEDIVDGLGLRVDKDDVAMALRRTISEGGDVARARDRVGQYGWSLEQFAQKVIKPSLYQERLTKYFNEQNTATPVMREQIEKAALMIEDGRGFGEAAKMYSKGTTADEGGVQGVFTRSQLDPEIAAVAFGLEVGEVSDVFETSYGLHILMVDDIVPGEVSALDAVSLRHIYVPKKRFAAYLNEEIQKRDIRVFLPKYEWDANANYVIFKDPELIAFEKKVIDEVVAAIETEAALIAETETLEDGTASGNVLQGDDGLSPEINLEEVN